MCDIVATVTNCWCCCFSVRQHGIIENENNQAVYGVSEKPQNNLEKIHKKFVYRHAS